MYYLFHEKAGTHTCKIDLTAQYGKYTGNELNFTSFSTDRTGQYLFNIAESGFGEMYIKQTENVITLANTSCPTAFNMQKSGL